MGEQQIGVPAKADFRLAPSMELNRICNGSPPRWPAAGALAAGAAAPSAAVTDAAPGNTGAGRYRVAAADHGVDLKSDDVLVG